MLFCGLVLFLTSKRQFPSSKINSKSISSHLFSHDCTCISVYLALDGWVSLNGESKEDKSTLFFPITPSSCSVHHSVEAFKNPLSLPRPSAYPSVQTNIVDRTSHNPPNQWIFIKGPYSSLSSSPPVYPSIVPSVLSFFSVPFSQRSRRKAPK